MPEKQIVRHQVHALEWLVAAWEDYWFVLSHLSQLQEAISGKPLFPAHRAMINFHQFRRFLLGLHQKEDDAILLKTVDPFWVPDNFPNELAVTGPFLLPVSLAGWTRHSRRVYRLDSDLQAILRATSLEAVQWQDIHLPFKSFAISLPHPLVATGEIEGRMEFDFLLISSYEPSPGTERLRIEAYSKCREVYEPLTRLQKEQIANGIGKKKWWPWLKHKLPELKRACSRALTSVSLDMIPSAFPQDLVLSEDKVLVGDKARDFYTQVGSVDIIRLVVGFVLYLRTLPPGSPRVSDPERPPLRSGIPDRKAITAESEIFTVSSAYALTPEERVILGLEGEEKKRAQYELGWHFREGHWRRPPGKGDDPTALRTVHVSPCIVRRDRMPESGGLPGGALKGDLNE